MFEHWLGLHPWDLERMTLAQVSLRLRWIKERLKSINGGEVVADG